MTSRIMKSFLSDASRLRRTEQQALAKFLEERKRQLENVLVQMKRLKHPKNSTAVISHLAEPEAPAPIQPST
jgi:hypothetical protein